MRIDRHLLIDFIEWAESVRKKIAIIGDSVVDEIYSCNMMGANPENPLGLIISTKSNQPDFSLLGGGGNVFRQIKNLKIDVDYHTFIDKKCLSFCPSNKEFILLNGKEIPRKKRFYNNDVILFRWDVESSQYELSDLELLEYQLILKKNVENLDCDVIILCDYDKGIFRNINLDFLKLSNNAIKIVDPKRHPIERWRGCDVIKLNKKEAFDLSGKKQFEEQCDYFIDKTNCNTVIITCSGEGYKLKSNGEYYEYNSDYKVIPKNIVGAGDNYISILAICLCCSFSVPEAAKIAFLCSSLLVQKGIGNLISWNDIAKYVNVL